MKKAYDDAKLPEGVDAKVIEEHVKTDHIAIKLVENIKADRDMRRLSSFWL